MKKILISLLICFLVVGCSGKKEHKSITQQNERYINNGEIQEIKNKYYQYVCITDYFSVNCKWEKL